MRRYAVIDVGSNSVRLMMMADGKVLYKTLSTTRLGEGLAQTGQLCGQAIQRTATAVEAFVCRARAEGAERIYAYATASVRSARNGGMFIEEVRNRCGITVDVVDGETEAEMGIIGALGQADGAVIDVGGASTELAVRKNGTIVYRASADIGVVRLKDVCGRDIRALQEKADGAVRHFADAPTLDKVYAIGGTATTLGALVAGLQTYDAEQVTGTEISLAKMRETANTFASLSVEEIKKFPCMPQGRAEVILGGTVLLVSLMEYLHVDGLTVSDRDNLEGYAIRKGLL